ncbi:ABC transporter permease subunit [Pseudactinotalea suaedae]|jgi:ABC-2 type transport system permease protein|uniref:ABC transporter permease subunit n=1 Tax=Pseudactinotalea suaedae TaxID=1524924 RepID=UPI0012E20E0F|nr:ABC transporter permease subunit [Pseudactinotalea suaedae]
MTAVAERRATSVPPTARVTFLGELRSEWIKFTAVRSTPWILGATVVVMVGLAAISAWSFSFLLSNPEDTGGPGVLPDDFDMAVQAAVAGYIMAQIVVAVLGVMVISGEYATGQIRSTLAAVPTRLPVLAAKGVVVSVTAFLTGLVGVGLGALVSIPLLSEHDVTIDLAREGTLLALLGAPLYLVAVALFALGVGTILRHTAGGIAVAVVIFFVIPLIWPNLSPDFFQETSPYLPSLAGARLLEGESATAALSPWQGYGVMLGWSALALLGGAVLLRRRDA